MIDNIITGLIRRIRPNFVRDSSLPWPTLMGWYVRKGLFPFLRGLMSLGRFDEACLPIFIGSGVKISYASKIRLGRSVSIGSGCVINAYSVDGIQIGGGCTIRENAWIQCSSTPSNPGIGLTIGGNTYIGPGAILGVGGPVVIGADCQIGAGFTVVAENHVRGNLVVSNSAVTREGIAIGAGCWIGHRVTVVDGVSLGRGCVVGAGAVVTKSFPAGSTLVGVPARLVASTPMSEPSVR